MTEKAIHGAASFSAIGYDFQTLDKQQSVITADMPDAWFDPSPKAVAKITGSLPFLLRTSPPADSEGLLETLSKVRSVPRESLLTGSGSSDLIFNCLPYLVQSGERVMVIDPLYGEYRHVCEKVIGTNVDTFYATKDRAFQVDAEALISDIRNKRPKLVFIVNPCNPTGAALSYDQLQKVASNLPETTSLFVDETYVEFSSSRRSLEPEAAKRRNLFVLKSMSKVYGLSGVRVGYIVAHPEWIERFSKTVPPWAVGLVAQVAAVEALSDPGYYEKCYEKTRQMREEMMKALQCSGPVKCYPSEANFFLVELMDNRHSSTRTAASLRSEDIFVRDCSTISTQFDDRFLRLAIKQPEHNQRLCERLLACLS